MADLDYTGKRSQSSKPTVYESMDKPQPLQEVMRAQSIMSYTDFRPGYVNFYNNNGRQWKELAESLHGFGGVFMKFSQQYQDREKERGIAEGVTKQIQFKEPEGYNKNRMAWKEAVKHDPSLANANPWVEVGWEQSRLKTMGLELKQGLQTMLEDSGIINDEDPNVVKAAINKYIQSFRDDLGITNHQNPILVAQHYSGQEAEARSAAMGEYHRRRFSARQDRLADQVATECVSIFGAKVSPVEKDAMLKAAIENASANGLIPEKVPDLILASAKSYFAQTKDRSILQKLKTIQLDDRRLIDMKGVAEWVMRTEDMLEAKDLRAAQKAEMAHNKFIRNLSASGAITAGREFAEGKYRTIEEAVDAWAAEHKVKLSPDDKFTFMHKAGQQAAHLRQMKSVENSTPEKMAEYKEDIEWNRKHITTNEGLQKYYLQEFRRTGSSLYAAAYDKAVAESKKEDAAGERTIGRVHTEAERAVKKMMDSLVTTQITAFKEEDKQTLDKSPKHDYNSQKAKGQMYGQSLEYFEDRVQFWTREWQRTKGDEATMTPAEYEDEVVKKALEDTRNVADSGGFSAPLTREGLMMPVTQVGETPAVTQDDFLLGMDNQQISNALKWRSSIDDFLKSSSNKTAYKSVDAMKPHFDIKKMAADGVTSVDVGTLIKYAKPDSVYYGAKVSPDGSSLTLQYVPGRNSERFLNAVAMDNPSMNITTDATTMVNSERRNTNALSSEEFAWLENRLDTTLTLAFLKKFDTRGELVQFLRDSSMSDSQIVDLLSDMKKEVKVKHNRKRPTTKD